MKRVTTLETGRSSSHSGGFTLVELLVVISIIIFLITMLAMTARGLLKRANIAATDSLLQRIGLFIDNYHGKTGSYPADGIDEALITDEGTPLQSGSALGYILRQPIRHREKLPTGEFRIVSSEQAVGEFTGPYIYRENGSKRRKEDWMIKESSFDLWSIGPDGINSACEGPDFDEESDDIGNW